MLLYFPFKLTLQRGSLLTPEKAVRVSVGRNLRRGIGREGDIGKGKNRTLVIGWVREKTEKKKKENETEREGLEGEEEVKKNQKGRLHC